MDEKQNKKKSEILSWIQIIVVAAVIAFLLNNFIIANSRVPSGSMENTIMTGNRIIGNRLQYKFSDPKRGDIVIFKFPDNEKKYFVKRIIGVGGDIIDIKNGKVYLNNSSTPLDEPYIKEPMRVMQDMHFEVPEGAYFCMGDNRNNSDDARFSSKSLAHPLFLFSLRNQLTWSHTPVHQGILHHSHCPVHLNLPLSPSCDYYLDKYWSVHLF